jgi:hypothetical protein
LVVVEKMEVTVKLVVREETEIEEKVKVMERYCRSFRGTEAMEMQWCRGYGKAEDTERQRIRKGRGYGKAEDTERQRIWKMRILEKYRGYKKNRVYGNKVIIERENTV